MKKFISLFLLMGALLIAIPPDAKAYAVEKKSKSEVYQEINQYRAEHGLQALEISKSLERSADVYAFKLHSVYSDQLRHDQAWVNRHKYLRSELLAYADDPFIAWTKSYRHNNLLLSTRFSSMGLGINKAGGYVLRVMDR
jgi:uncharacterized protein YkwD